MWIETVLLVLTLYILWQSLKKPSDYPPGPWGLPLIGHIPLTRKRGDEILKELNEKHGDVISMRIGTKLVVFVFDYKLIKEAFMGKDMVDRPSLKVFSLLNEKKHLGIVSSNGIHWHSIRRFSLRHLRDLGMGKSRLVSAVQNEAVELVKDLKKQAGKPAPMPYSLIVSILNVIWQMVASKRYSLDDKEIKEFHHAMTDVQENMGRVVITDFYPWITYIVPNFLLKRLTKEYLLDDISNKLSEFFKVAVDDHMKNLDKNNPKDYIDDYLVEMENQKNDPSSTMSIEDLNFCIADLFGAGSETTTTTLQFIVFYLANYPQIQTRLQKEIDDALPNGILATLEDKPRLLYTEAFIHEILRHSSMASLIGMHMASVDTKLGGYVIPKGAIVVGASFSCHYNPNNFESPNEFRPERYLDSDGKFVSPKEGFMPFGIGRRQCLGEALARMEIFIFLTTMVQSLNFNTPPGKTIDLNPLENNPLMRLPKAEQEILVTIRS